MLRYFSAMGRELLGEGHPLNVACGMLTSLDQLDQMRFEEVIDTSLRTVAKAFEEGFEPKHLQTRKARLQSLLVPAKASVRSKGQVQQKWLVEFYAVHSREKGHANFLDLRMDSAFCWRTRITLWKLVT